MDGTFPKFEFPKKIPEPANSNLEINPEARNILDDIGNTIEKALQTIEVKKGDIRNRLRIAQEDNDRAGIAQAEEILANVNVIEHLCADAAEKRRQLLNEPDDDTLRDARGLRTDLNIVLTEYEQYLGE